MVMCNRCNSNPVITDGDICPKCIYEEELEDIERCSQDATKRAGKYQDIIKRVRKYRELRMEEARLMYTTRMKGLTLALQEEGSGQA